ncbi:hypothetical protein EYF80_027537 [Liparis tanakae]|uniref:Uncharacterized protein n=1 Tax=Liparis tanakae TaxID=230148 RepID=A0A4Z2HB93_9TELE|nr:hypothetical protein EYF80_027537 [Liparis tanakae]
MQKEHQSARAESVVIIVAASQHLELVLSSFLLQQAVGLESGKIVDCGKLDKRRRHKGKTHGDEPVHGGGIGYFGQ